MTDPRIRKLRYLPVSDLKPNPRNPRVHKRAQVRALAKSIKSFGFNAPVLVDSQHRLIAGHGRWEAAKLAGLEQIPVVTLDDLTEAQATAYMIADNAYTDRSEWDEELLARHLKELSELAIDFDLEDTGFELPQIDLLIQGLEEQPETDALDEFKLETGPAVARLNELWHLEEHKLYCGNALEGETYNALLGTEKAAGVFTDPPYDARIKGNVSGNGQVIHREFVMGSGELGPEKFTAFLTSALDHAHTHSCPGALIYTCMDWRSVGPLTKAGETAGLDLLNVCVWVKTNGGMGSLYRSQHELVFVFRNGTETHRNNVQLGRYGRNRSNVWHYPGANCFAGRGKASVLNLHPTVKPTALVADAIMDSTVRGEIVLDPFLGSGTTVLACERTGRRGFGIELDPLYVDTAILRWQRMTGKKARLATGEAFDDLKNERIAE